jgi:hypothetical protein
LNSEIAEKLIPSVLANGNSLVWRDLLGGFNCNIYEDMVRARFMCTVLDVLNIKIRMWLWQFVPPHPSFTLTWIFSLVLCPIFLFKLMRNLTSDRSAAWIAVLLYGVSPGLLSGVQIFFHSAKPLSSFFTIFCLYLASRLDLSLRDHERMMPRDALAFLLLLAVLFIGFFTDELSYFTFVAVPVMFPHIWISIIPKTGLMRRFRVTAKTWVRASLYLVIPIAFFLLITFVIPHLMERLGIGYFNFWQGIQARAASMSKNSYLAGLSLNTHHLLANHMMPFISLSGATVDKLFNGPPLMTFFERDIYFYVAYLAYILFTVRRIPDTCRPVFFRVLATLVLFCVFYNTLHSSQVIAFSGLYYGCTFSVYFVLALAMLLSVRKGLVAIFNKVLLVLLLVVSATNSISLNAASNEHIGQNYQTNSNTYSKVELLTSRYLTKDAAVEWMSDSQIVTYAKVREAWQKRKNRVALQAMIPRFPVRASWLFLELQYMEREDALENSIQSKTF